MPQTVGEVLRNSLAQPLQLTQLFRHSRNLPGALLFWLNTISAVVDNATLAAVEIGPALSRNQQHFAMLGLLIGAGMLIPGNIPTSSPPAGWE
ncbi:MAG: DUF1646 family protein [Candidatus Binatus sp.]|uniref:DUF1646 family protein n=1 Tax=Candidatus Binatus sp. TaxID=2811406 RepID=UPI003BAE7D38